MRNILIILLCCSSVFATAQVHKGYRGFVDVGHVFTSLSQKDYFIDPRYEMEKEVYQTASLKNSFSISTTHGYQFSSNLFIGGGIGLTKGKEKFIDMSPYEAGDIYWTQYIRNGRINIFSAFCEIRFDFPLWRRLSVFEANKIGFARMYDTGSRFAFNFDKNGVFFAPSLGVRYQVDDYIGINLALSYQYFQNRLYVIDKFEFKSNGFCVTIGFDFQS